MRKLTFLLLVAPLALAACGGSSSTQLNVDPVVYVKHAATKTADLKSEHMVMTGTIGAAGQSISLQGHGDFANSPPKGSFTMSLSGMGQNLAMNEVIEGTTFYVSSPAFAGKLPAGKTWVKADLAQLGKSTGINYSSLMSQSPTQILGKLQAAGSVRSLGTETIDGVATTHYQVTKIDISKLPQGGKIQALAHPTYGPVDVWIGNSDGYVYRESLSFSYSVQGQSASMTMRVDLSKFNEAVTATVPPASKTLDIGKRLGG
jgi:hypothetical protein